MKVSSISQLVRLALSPGNVHGEYTFAKLPRKQAKLIEKDIQIDLTGAERVMDTSFIRHSILEHGNAKTEERRGQVALTTDDFLKVPMVLREPDEIKYAGKNKLKQDVFLYKKKIGMLYIVAEAVRLSKRSNKLVFQTMYKIK